MADASSSPVAAAYVMAGLAPLASREALAMRITPASPLLLAAVEAATRRALERWRRPVGLAPVGRFGPAPPPRGRSTSCACGPAASSG